MEKLQRVPAEPPFYRRGQNSPSFSSSLLEAVYRSIDESDSGSPRLSLSAASNKQSNPKDKNMSMQSPAPPHFRRRHVADVADDRGHWSPFATPSSSSDCSSFGGFSSDADSIARPRPVLTRCAGVRPDPPPEKKRPSSIRNRLCCLRSPGNPASPGTRLSAFLNAIFPGGSGNSKKSKFAGGDDDSETASVRSAVRKKPASSRGEKQRPVRFTPSGVSAAAVDAKPASSGREERHCAGAPARNSRMMVEELLRRLEMEEEEEDSDRESVSSSELFELDSLSSVGRYRDELPVYGTTNPGAGRAYARRFVV